MKDIIEKAKRKYPIGAKCSNRNLGKNCEFKISTAIFRSYEQGEVIWSTDGGSSYTVYLNGEWADVLEYPEGYKIPGEVVNEYQIY